MNITVLFFASLKEEMGVDELEVSLSIGADRARLMSTLSGVLGSKKVSLLDCDEVSIAVNQAIEKSEFVLHAGDEVAFLPPITGG